jgi:hypothetical protein
MKEITRCGVCNNTFLTSVMNLGDHPLPDDLVPFGDDRVCIEYPIEVMFCDVCKTAQQRWELPKAQLFFPEYHYRGGNTKDVLLGMEQLVDAIELQHPVQGLKVLDVGCNDGSLLDVFRRRGAITFGIEPTNAAQEAIAKGHAVSQAFLDYAEANRYVKAHGSPDIITFTNVFAHIENLPGLLACLGIIRGLHTRIVIENHYLGSVLEKKQFDTFYHEHLRTYSLTSFFHIAKNMDMHVETVEFPKRYGGNIRVTLEAGARPGAGPTAWEENFKARMRTLADQVGKWKQRKRLQLLEEIVHDNSAASAGIIPVSLPLPAAAFPTRASLLFGLLGFDERHIEAVYESGKQKPGHYVPGTRIQIRHDSDFNWTRSGPVINMAWHIPDEIAANWRKRGYQGKFIQIIAEEDFS